MTPDDQEIKPQLPKKKSAKPADLRKRELKSTKREGGVPILEKKKKKSKKWWWIGGGVVVAFFAAVFLTPRIGTIHYGICKTYLELHDPYPEFLEYVQSYESGNLVVIDYNRTDGFGQRTLNQIRCVFKKEGNTNEIARIDVNGKANIYEMESEAMIKKFNLGIMAILTNKPSLVMPKGFPEDIKDYK
ncbi:MAG: hypothetical protein DI586_07985 [Micavibrio aeruginosavorus]|uniref:Uncharacterized protein n=1 Tax=Micavibrio aeruginosavorus TaxID=349221 RepID=A0A2W5HMM8_9BACT|nr:MAG: hypothetical protein DI586_07985 [Micavibrio aeruginosavorus]